MSGALVFLEDGSKVRVMLSPPILPLVSPIVSERSIDELASGWLERTPMKLPGELKGLAMNGFTEDDKLLNSEISMAEWIQKCDFIRIGHSVARVVRNPELVMGIKLGGKLVTGGICFPILRTNIGSAVGLPTSEGFDTCGRGQIKVMWQRKIFKEWREIGKSAYIDLKDLPAGTEVRASAWFEALPQFPKIMENPSKVVGGTEALTTLISRSDAIARFANATGSDFSLLCYNVLADVYATSSSKYAFAYCPKFAWNWTYRSSLLVRTIVATRAKILCLQEVQVDAFFGSLGYYLHNHGYEGRAKAKTGAIREGVATFWDTADFDMVADLSCCFKTIFPLIIPEASLARFHEVWPRFFRNDLPKVSTVFNILLLHHKLSGKLVLVSNTHLVFQPTASHFRCFQLASLVQLLELYRWSLSDIRRDSTLLLLSQLRNRRDLEGPLGLEFDMTECIAYENEFAKFVSDLILRRDEPEEPFLKCPKVYNQPSVICVGDFNSTHSSLSYKFLKEGSLKDNWWDLDRAFCTFERIEKPGTKESELPRSRMVQYNRSTSLVDKLGTISSKPPSGAPGGGELKNPIFNGGCWDAYLNLHGDEVEGTWTNKVTGFEAVLDYICCDSSLSVSAALDVPKISDNGNLEGIPSRTDPSDHIPIGVHFSFLD